MYLRYLTCMLSTSLCARRSAWLVTFACKPHPYSFRSLSIAHAMAGSNYIKKVAIVGVRCGEESLARLSRFSCANQRHLRPAATAANT